MGNKIEDTLEMLWEKEKKQIEEIDKILAEIRQTHTQIHNDIQEIKQIIMGGENASK